MTAHNIIRSIKILNLVLLPFLHMTRDYEDVPLIRAHPSKLQQVWTAVEKVKHLVKVEEL